ncbi:MAG: protein-disulfide reductase DsbD family protein [Candidatus Kapabacteria bacterium]|nr:protein-disulfide reductase DsbD family protein [Candidatus Kapabacteria bacterium]
MLKSVYISIFFALLLFNGPLAYSKVKSNVNVKLYSSQSVISPGDEIQLAVEFRIKNQWHIYWENPGDAGMATTLEFTLPEGFKVGRVLYPYPSKCKTEGLTSFGYKDNAVLLTKIKVPDYLQKDENYKIKIKAIWLECKHICIPGETELEITLKAKEGAKTKKVNSFKNYLRNIPKSLAGLDAQMSMTEQSAILNLKFPDFLDQNSLSFDIFPLNETIFVHSQKPKIKKDKNGFSIELDFDPFKVDIPEKLEFVLVIDEKNAKIIDSKSIYFKVNTRN